VLSAPCARGPSGPPMDGFFFFTQTRPTAPGSLTAHRFTPPGTLRGPGRSRAARSRPVWLGPTRIPARPTRLRPTQTRSRCHPCPAQADSDHRQSTRLRPTRTQRPAASHDAGHSGFTGPGLALPRACSPHSDRPNCTKSQGGPVCRGGVRGCYYDKFLLDAQQGWTVPGRESHTTAPAVWHTVPSCRRTSWVRTPSASHRVVPSHTRLRMTTQIRATSEGACSISRGGALAHCRGFGTCGWTDVGAPSIRTRLWDPLPRRHGLH